MKIVQIGSFPINTNLIKGGVEASVYGISKVLSIENEVHVIDFPRRDFTQDEIEVIDNINVYRFRSIFKSNFLAFTNIRRILRVIRKIQPDICHLHATSLFTLILTFFLDAYKLKRVLTIHGLVHIEKKQMLKSSISLKRLLQYYYQSFTEFVIISRSKFVLVDTKYVEKAVEKYRLERKISGLPQIKIIPQGISDSYFKMTKPELSKVSKIISIGTINERKGHLLLLEAFYEIKKKYPEIQLVIIGVKSDLSYFKILNDKITALQIEDKVQVLTDVENETIIKHLITSQIFTLHTREESQGIVFCEAMACGLPIVTTNVGGVGDVLSNEKNGLLSEYGDVETFTFNLKRVIEDFKLRSVLSTNNIIESHRYKWNIIALQTIDVYHSVN